MTNAIVNMAQNVTFCFAKRKNPLVLEAGSFSYRLASR